MVVMYSMSLMPDGGGGGRRNCRYHNNRTVMMMVVFFCLFSYSYYCLGICSYCCFSSSGCGVGCNTGIWHSANHRVPR